MSCSRGPRARTSARCRSVPQRQVPRGFRVRFAGPKDPAWRLNATPPWKRSGCRNNETKTRRSPSSSTTWTKPAPRKMLPRPDMPKSSPASRRSGARWSASFRSLPQHGPGPRLRRGCDRTVDGSGWPACTDRSSLRPGLRHGRDGVLPADRTRAGYKLPGLGVRQPLEAVVR
jgi:hypothetical protein